APLMDMNFAISCALVRRSRLIFGFCPSTRTFDPCFFQTPTRGGSPCIIARPSPPSRLPEDLHLQDAEHAQHTPKPLRGWTASHDNRIVPAFQVIVGRRSSSAALDNTVFRRMLGSPKNGRSYSPESFDKDTQKLGVQAGLELTRRAGLEVN